MAWVKHLTMAAVGLAALGLANSAQAVTINFGAIPIGGTPSYTGASLETSTAFNFGGGSYQVNVIGPGDQSTLAVGNLISLTNPVYGPGNVGALTDHYDQVVDDPVGTFTETLTSFIINRATLTRLHVFSGHPYGTAVSISNCVCDFECEPGWRTRNRSQLVPHRHQFSSSTACSTSRGLAAVRHRPRCVGLLGWRKKRKAQAAVM